MSDIDTFYEQVVKQWSVVNKCLEEIVHICQGLVWYYVEALVTATCMTCMDNSLAYSQARL